MHLGMIVQTDSAERVWNGIRLANTALAKGHTVEVFLLGNGVDAPDRRHEKINPRGIFRKYLSEGGTIIACGTCLDSRDIEPDELRPRGKMDDCLRIVEEADEVLTIG